MMQLSGFCHGGFGPEGLKAAAIAFAKSAITSPPIASPMIKMKMPVAISMTPETGSWRASSTCVWRASSWAMWIPVAGAAAERLEAERAPRARVDNFIV